jgi:hypothetical protein
VLILIWVLVTDITVFANSRHHFSNLKPGLDLKVLLDMDLISAVGFAASIITFVNFASELVSGASELYKSPTGHTAHNIHIENVINDLQDVADDLNTDSLGN